MSLSRFTEKHSVDGTSHEKVVSEQKAAAGSNEKIESKVAVQACMEGARTEEKLMEESKREGEVLMEQEVLHSGEIGGQEVVVVVQQPLFSKLAGTMPKARPDRKWSAHSIDLEKDCNDTGKKGGEGAGMWKGPIKAWPKEMVAKSGPEGKVAHVCGPVHACAQSLWCPCVKDHRSTVSVSV